MMALACYFVVGALLAVVIARSTESDARIGERWLSAVLCVLLWPLWAPIAWNREAARCAAVEVEEARSALREAEAVVVGTPLEALLTADIAARILGELEQLAARRDELRRLARASDSGARRGSDDALLLDLAERDTRRLSELVDVVRSLRTRLVLARYGGASLDGVGDLLVELTTRVESLDEVFSPPRDTDAGARLPV